MECFLCIMEWGVIESVLLLSKGLLMLRISQGEADVFISQ